jgi:hypothetical protein
LPLAGEVVLTPSVALNLHHPRLSKITFPVSAPYNLNCVGAPVNQTKKYYRFIFAFFKVLFHGDFSFFSGELDHVPEVAFYMVGNIEEVLQKADRLADEKK